MSYTVYKTHGVLQFGNANMTWPLTRLTGRVRAEFVRMYGVRPEDILASWPGTPGTLEAHLVPGVKIKTKE